MTACLRYGLGVMTAQFDLLDPGHYEAVRRPLLEAETLPAWCYTSEVFFRAEKERIFKRYWSFVGRADELSSPGDFLCVDIASGPAVVLRGTDDRLRAFANSCRHRGARLLDGQGRCPAIVCPYHAWTYALDGCLVGAPDMAEAVAFDRSEHGLQALRLETWGGFIFITADPETAPLADHLGDLPAQFAAHDPERLRCTRRVSFDIAANWKLVAENALEAYHTGSVHRASLGRQEAEPIATRGGWTGLRVLDEASVATLPGEPAPFPAIPGLAGDALRGTAFTLVYPATQFAFAQDCVWWLDIRPLGPARTRLVLGSCFPEATVAQTGFARQAEAYYRRWDLATPEDNGICEAQQHGLASDLRRPGRFAAAEFAVHAFDNWVIDQVVDRVSGEIL